MEGIIRVKSFGEGKPKPLLDKISRILKYSGGCWWKIWTEDNTEFFVVIRGNDQTKRIIDQKIQGRWPGHIVAILYVGLEVIWGKIKYKVTKHSGSCNPNARIYSYYTKGTETIGVVVDVGTAPDNDKVTKSILSYRVAVLRLLPHHNKIGLKNKE